MRLTSKDRDVLAGGDGEAAALALRIVVEMAHLTGAERLVSIASAHLDGCLYHGDGGVEFAERLVAGGGQVRVPTTLNVGALDLLHPQRVGGSARRRTMARRQMEAYRQLGCRPTWTCAPYQTGHRPRRGEHVAWGESNAVAFANSVLGARTNRYGDFLDVCCALTGRAPLAGLHLDAHRRAEVVVDASAIPPSLARADVFYPVLGSWLGRTVGNTVAVVEGLPSDIHEDQLKALGAAAASTGAVGLFHIVGVTPEAPDLNTALGGRPPRRIIRLTARMLVETRDRLTTSAACDVHAVAVGSPHFSLAEFAQLGDLLRGRPLRVPFYVCTARDTLHQLTEAGHVESLTAAGVQIIVDTCVVVSPILPAVEGGVLMTNSGKFANYSPSLIGYDVIYGSLGDCVESACAGRLVRDEKLWAAAS